LAAYQQALRIKPDYAAAYHDIAWIKNDQDDYSAAVTNLKQALRYKPDYPEAHSELGYSYRKLGRYSEAVEEYKEAIRLKPDFGLAHLGLGDVYFYNTKQYPDAIKAYKKVSGSGLTVQSLSISWLVL